MPAFLSISSSSFSSIRYNVCMCTKYCCRYGYTFREGKHVKRGNNEMDRCPFNLPDSFFLSFYSFIRLRIVYLMKENSERGFSIPATSSLLLLVHDNRGQAVTAAIQPESPRQSILLIAIVPVQHIFFHFDA